MKKNNPSLNNSGGFLKYTGMAFQMIGSILIFVFLGHYLDSKFQVLVDEVEELHKNKEFPFFTFLGTLIGVASSLYLAIKSLKK